MAVREPTFWRANVAPLILEVHGVCEPPRLRQLPPTAKHPVAMLIPFAAVDVPVPLIAMLPPKVLVAVVVPVKYAPTICPTTESFAYGLDVPMPTFPFARNEASVRLFALISKIFPVPS